VVCFEKSPDYLKDFINTEFYQRYDQLSFDFWQGCTGANPVYKIWAGKIFSYQFSQQLLKTAS
jgi:hypothetical protein